MAQKGQVTCREPRPAISRAGIRTQDIRTAKPRPLSSSVSCSIQQNVWEPRAPRSLTLPGTTLWEHPSLEKPTASQRGRKLTRGGVRHLSARMAGPPGDTSAQTSRTISPRLSPPNCPVRTMAPSSCLGEA